MLVGPEMLRGDTSCCILSARRYWYHYTREITKHPLHAVMLPALCRLLIFFKYDVY